MPKKVVPLTDSKIKQAKPKEKQYSLSDGDGLQLIVPAANSKRKKYFRFDYTRPSGKRNSISFGTYPEITLAQAREKRQKFREMLAQGQDPAIVKKQESEKQLTVFSNVAADFYEKTAKTIAETTASNYQRYINYMNQAFGSKDINDITIKDISTLLLEFDLAGKRETAERILRLLKAIYKYAISRGLIVHNIANDISAKDLLSKKEEKHFAFIDNEKEFAQLLLAIDEYFGDIIVKLALQFAAMTFLRPGNVRALEWEYVDFSKSIIEVPFDDMKSDRKHMVPITKQIEDVLKQAAQFSKGKSKYVFPSTISNVKMLSENTLNTAIKRMGFGGKMTSHGFRHTASTLLHEWIYEHKVHSEAIEMQLAHKDENKIRRTYNHAKYLPERKRLMQWWCDYLDQIKAAYA